MIDELEVAEREVDRIKAEMQPIEQKLKELSESLYQAECSKNALVARELFGLALGSKVMHKIRGYTGFLIGFEPHYVTCSRILKSGEVSASSTWGSKLENLEVIE